MQVYTCGNIDTSDVWFEFTMPVNGTIVITTDTIGNSLGLDGILQLFTASTCNAPLQYLGCDDDNGPGNMPQLTFPAAANTQYYIRICPWGGSNTNIDFKICINYMVITNVGIGTSSPSEKLDVIGNIKADTLKLNSIQLPNAAGLSKVLTSDANGNASWQTPPIAPAESQSLSSTAMGNVTISPGNTTTIKGSIASVGVGGGTIGNTLPAQTGPWELANGYVSIFLDGNQRIVFTASAALGRNIAGIFPSSINIDAGWADNSTPAAVTNTSGGAYMIVSPAYSVANERQIITVSGQFKPTTAGSYRIGFACQNSSVSNVGFWNNNDYQNVTYTIINE